VRVGRARARLSDPSRSHLVERFRGFYRRRRAGPRQRPRVRIAARSRFPFDARGTSFRIDKRPLDEADQADVIRRAHEARERAHMIVAKCLADRERWAPSRAWGAFVFAEARAIRDSSVRAKL